VVTVLEKNQMMPSGIMIHGLKVLVKGRTLKRASTLLKHSRFLKNLRVVPVFPPEPEPVPEEEGEDGEDREDRDSDE